MRDIWLLQLRLQQTQPKRAIRLLSHPKFRAAYDFLLLRARIENDPKLKQLGEFWTDFQRQSPEVTPEAAPKTNWAQKVPAAAWAQ